MIEHPDSDYYEEHCDCENDHGYIPGESTSSSPQPPMSTETTPKKEISTTHKPTTTTTTTESFKTSSVPSKPKPTDLPAPCVNRSTTASPVKPTVTKVPCPTNPHCDGKCGVHKGSCDRVGYMPHPSDCRKFLQCVDQGEYRIEKFEFECPKLTAWDQTKLTCDHEDNVKACYPDKEEFKCPGDGFFADPDDCGRFYRCVCVPGGPKRMEKFHMSCAPGSSFDEKTGICNFSHLVEGCGADPVPCEACQ